MLNFLVGDSDGIAMLTSVILGALTVVLVLVVFGLVVENSKLQTGTFSVTVSLLFPVEMFLTFVSMLEN